MSKATRDFVTGYLTAQGVPAHVAAGIAGNLAVESDNFHPDVISGKRTGDKGRSKYGFQWNDTRLENFEAYAREHNRDPRDILTQVDFMMAEVNPRSKYADPQAVKGATAIFGAQNPEQAAEAFSRHYERPSYPNMNGRKTAAVQAYEGWFSARTTNAPTPYGRDEEPLAAAPQLAMADREIVPGLGLANLTPSIDYSPLSAAGKGRSMVPTSGIADKVAIAANSVVPGVTASVWSGQEPPGRAPVGARDRHPRGFAGDFDFIDPMGNRITDPVAMHDIAMTMAAQHNANIGYSQTGYMGPGRIHIDTMPLDQFPGAPQWGRTALGWADNLDFARAYGIGPTPYSNAPVPTSREVGLAMPTAPQQGPSARSAQEASMAALSPAPAPSARSAQEQSMAALSQAAPSIASAPQAGPSARSAEEMSMAALSAQPSFAPSPRSAEDYSMAAFAPSQPAQTATEALDALAAPQDEQIDMGSWGQVAQAAPQSINIAQAPAIAPMQAPVAPAPAPVAYSAPAPVSRTPAPSMASGLDFWGGKANVAVSNSGAQLSRDIHGNTYNYSPSYDVTTISNSLGDVIGTQQGKVSIDDSGNPAGGRGIFSGGIFGDDGIFSGANVQNTVVGSLGQLGGTVIGGAVLGAPGAFIGGALGKHLAQSKFGVPQVQTPFGFINPAMIDAARRGFTPGLGFPDAPTGGAGWGGWVDGSGPGSRGYAESISPGAADAIDAGKGGLY